MSTLEALWRQSQDAGATEEERDAFLRLWGKKSREANLGPFSYPERRYPGPEAATSRKKHHAPADFLRGFAKIIDGLGDLNIGSDEEGDDAERNG